MVIMAILVHCKLLYVQKHIINIVTIYTILANKNDKGRSKGVQMMSGSASRGSPHLHNAVRVIRVSFWALLFANYEPRRACED